MQPPSSADGGGGPNSRRRTVSPCIRARLTARPIRRCARAAVSARRCRSWSRSSRTWRRSSNGFPIRPGAAARASDAAHADLLHPHVDAVAGQRPRHDLPVVRDRRSSLTDTISVGIEGLPDYLPDDPRAIADEARLRSLELRSVRRRSRASISTCTSNRAAVCRSGSRGSASSARRPRC